MSKLFEILFVQNIQLGDLEIITSTTWEQPGRARLKKACLGPPNPSAPNSLPVLSHSGAKIGFVAEGEAQPPCAHTYWLEE